MRAQASAGGGPKGRRSDSCREHKGDIVKCHIKAFPSSHQILGPWYSGKTSHSHCGNASSILAGSTIYLIIIFSVLAKVSLTNFSISKFFSVSKISFNFALISGFFGISRVQQSSCGSLEIS